MNSKIIMILIALLNINSSPSMASGVDPDVVNSVDLKSYVGKWYEIGRYPNFFQNQCERSTAEYGQNPDGSLSVLNSCFKNNSIINSIKGKATVVDQSQPAKLMVDFGWFRKGDYWIIGLDPNYQWAVVSGPKKQSLFILAREAPMEKELLQKIVGDLKTQGFDPSKIIYDIY